MTIIPTNCSVIIIAKNNLLASYHFSLHAKKYDLNSKVFNINWNINMSKNIYTHFTNTRTWNRSRLDEGYYQE